MMDSNHHASERQRFRACEHVLDLRVCQFRQSIFDQKWWARGDSNPYPFRDQILSLARLPTTPLAQIGAGGGSRTHTVSHQILSLARMPFRHTGFSIYSIFKDQRTKKKPQTLRMPEAFRVEQSLDRVVHSLRRAQEQ